MYTALVFDPIFNLLLWFVELSGYSMGLAVILLTVVIRIILYMPMHRSMMHSKTMQELQPKIAEIKKLHGDNQQQMAMATMALYKEHGVNPFSSCLPILLQIPVLLGVFGVLRLDFSDAAVVAEHAYSSFKDIDLTKIQFDFFGFDMGVLVSDAVSGGAYVYLALPVLVGVTQYYSLKLAMASSHKKVQDITPNESDEPDKMKQMESMSKLMLKFLPLFVTAISYTFQSALSLYWIVSTLFGIGQQFVINAMWKRRNAAGASSNSDVNVKVEVIE